MGTPPSSLTDIVIGFAPEFFIGSRGQKSAERNEIICHCQEGIIDRPEEWKMNGEGLNKLQIFRILNFSANEDLVSGKMYEWILEVEF